MRLARPLTASALLLGLFATACSDGALNPDRAETVGQGDDALVGGTATTVRPEIGQYIYVKADGKATLCTATLIAPRVVLTAAHCFNWNDTVARSGSAFFGTGRDGTPYSYAVDAMASYSASFA